MSEPFVYTFDGAALTVEAAESEFRDGYVRGARENGIPESEIARLLNSPTFRENFNNYVDCQIMCSDWRDARDFGKCDPVLVAAWLNNNGAYFCEDCADYAIENGAYATEDSGDREYECAYCNDYVSSFYTLEW